MKALVVYCHPREESFTAAVRDIVVEKLEDAGAEVRLSDLYARAFDPVLTATEHEKYLDCPENCAPVEEDVEDVSWCDTLIFVYPTWWYGLPAVLKGWLDRVFLPDVAFLMPDDENATIRPGLKHITRLGGLYHLWRVVVVDAASRRAGQTDVDSWCWLPLQTSAQNRLCGPLSDGQLHRRLAQETLGKGRGQDGSFSQMRGLP